MSAPSPAESPTDTTTAAHTRRLGGQVVLRVVVRLGSAAMQAATLLLLARELGPSSFGTLAVLAATGTLLCSVANLGASTRVLRVGAEGASDEERSTLAASLFWMQGLGSGVVLVGLLVASLVLRDPAPAVVGSLLAVSDQQAEFTVASLSGHARQAAASVMIVVQRGLPLAALGVAVLTGLPVLGPVGVAVLAVGGLAVAWAPVRRVTARAVRAAARSSIGYWFSGLVLNLRQLEPLVVSTVGGVGAAGLYAIAARVSNPLTILVTSLQAIAVPEMARARDARQFRRTFRLLLGVAVAYAAILVLASPLVAAVFLWIVGPEYDGARTLVTVMVACAGLSAVSQALQGRLLALGRPGLPAWIIGIATVIGIAVLAVTSGIDGGRYLWAAPLTAQSLILVALALVPARLPDAGRPGSGDPAVPEGRSTT